MSTERTPIPMIGFFTMEKTLREDGYITALMITDNKGYPLEFKATTPVHPSLVQRTLYGDKLEHYIGVELCGKQLVNQSGRKPRVFVIPDRKLLDLADATNKDFVALWRSGDSIKVDDNRDESHRGTLKSVSSQPIVYQGRYKSESTEKEIITFLEVCSNNFDLVETFERIRAALQLLAKEDSRYA